MDDLLGGVGLSSKDAGSQVTRTGADPVLPGPVRIGGAATISLLAKSIAAAALHRDRGGPGQDVSADLRRAPHRLCPFYDRTGERIGGYPRPVHTGDDERHRVHVLPVRRRLPVLVPRGSCAAAWNTGT